MDQRLEEGGLSELTAEPVVQATGFSVHIIAPVICGICIFYTTIGGLKAVVWTDTIQMAMMVASTALVFILGVRSVGGISNIIDRSAKGHRLDIFDFNFDPTIRDGICALIIGTSSNHIGLMSVSQATIQRYLAVPSIDDARKVITVFAVGVALVKLSSVFTGLAIYAKYANCDPISTGIVKRSDQILPYYILDVAGHIPGLPGLFIAGLFSASLSTLSATLNTMAATIYEDFVSPFMPTNVSEKCTSYTLRLITVIVGITCTMLVLVIEKMGSLLPLASGFTAVTLGPLVGLYSLGMLFPMANSKGALCGAITASVLLTWTMAGNHWYKQQTYYVDPLKPFSTDGCGYQVNATKSSNTSTVKGEPFYLYQVTFWYYSLMGSSVTILIGIAISWLTKSSYPPVHSDLLCPLVTNRVKRVKDSGISESIHLNERKALNTTEMTVKKCDM